MSLTFTVCIRTIFGESRSCTPPATTIESPPPAMIAVSTIARVMRPPAISASIGGERRADDLLVVAGVDVFVGVCRVQPAHVHQLAPVLWRRRGLDQLRAAHLVIAVG